MQALPRKCHLAWGQARQCQGYHRVRLLDCELAGGMPRANTLPTATLVNL